MARLQLYASLDARDRLDRLAWHLGYSVTELVEQLAESAEPNVEAKLTGKALKTCRDGGLPRHGMRDGLAPIAGGG